MDEFRLNVGARQALRPTWARARLAAVLVAVLLTAGGTVAGAVANAGAFVESLGQQVLSVLKKTEDAGARRAEVPALLQKDPRLFDPYTAQAMAWDGGGAGIRASARGRHTGLPATVRVGDFLR